MVSREGGAAVKTGAFDEFEKHQIARRFPAMVPHATCWIENRVLFHAQLGDSVNLWQISISPKTFRVEGPAQRLTSGSGLEMAPSVARHGALVFSSVVANGDIWALPVEALLRIGRRTTNISFSDERLKALGPVCTCWI